MQKIREIKDFRELLYQSAELHGDKTAFLQKDENGKIYGISYKKLKCDAESLAKELIKRGFKDKKIAVSGKNSYEWCLSYLAVTCFVGCIVPLDKETPKEEFENVLAFSEAQVFIGDSTTTAKIGKSRKDLFIISMDKPADTDEIYIHDLISAGEKIDDTTAFDSEIDSDKMSVLLFTSGTTGMTKGVMLSQKNICSDLVSVCSYVDVCKDDTSLSVLPLHHTYECIAFLMVIYCGATVAFSKGIRTLKEDFISFKPTVLVCVPLLLEKFHSIIVRNMEEKGKRKKAQLISKMSSIISEEHRKKVFGEIHQFFGGRLQKIIVGAAALSEEIARDFASFGFKIIIGYGLTECSPIVICNSVDSITLDSIGKPLGTVQAKIADKDENGVGEICVKGPMVMLGYYKNPQTTEEVMKDGWFHTGDLGYVDKNGCYHITGRKKNVIVTRNGKNIYPEELELYLLRHAVIKETIVTSERGDIITAHILPDEEQISLKYKKENLTPADIKKAVTEAVRAVNRKVPSYKNIRDIVIRDKEFVKTTTHKIKRQEKM